MKLNPHTVNTFTTEPDPVIVSPSSPSGPEIGNRRLATPSAALNEFRAALDIWFPLMDVRTKVEAIQMAEDWRPPSPKKRGGNAEDK